jgi:energy-coupling factor transport system ATP-binding protein
LSLIKFEDFCFRYSDQELILSDINFEVNDGEFVLFCGPSGSGKTTILSNMKNEIRPIGKSEGAIYYDGLNIRKLEDEKSASEIGYLFQNPEDQFVSDNVLQEIAFSLENMGLPHQEIRNRIAEMTAFFGLDNYLYKNVNELSGGQKQLVNLCSLLVLKPRLLLLDEPTSQLDPIAAYDFLSILRRLNEEFSITIILTEHKIDNIFPFIDRAVFLEGGKIKYADKPRQISTEAQKSSIFQNYLPSATRIHFLLKSKYNLLDEAKIPLSIREGRANLKLIDKHLKKIYDSRTSLWNGSTNKTSSESKKKFKNIPNYIINCQNIWFAYVKDQMVLNGIFLDVNKGEFISILGGNGTGKTTFIQILAGLMNPVKGNIQYKNNIRLAYVNQNPKVHFKEETVEDELSESSLENPDNDLSLKRKKLKFNFWNNNVKSTSNSKNQVEFNRNVNSNEKNDLIELFDLTKLLDKHPYDCSGGEQQKIAISKALLTKPDVLFLDEPTKGIDPVSKIQLGLKLKRLQKNGLTIIMTTHDIDFAAEYSERSILLFDGNIQVDDTPTKVFSKNNFYTTFVNRMVKDYLPNSLTLKEVKQEWEI